MVAIEFRFLAGRYHATPWDSQVNEGLVEWPPSPWRILRTLISTWYFKAREEVLEEDFERIIGKLSEQLPAYSLPFEQVSLSHTRHFMPLFDGKTRKVFDTFIRLFDNGPLVVVWRTLELMGMRQSAWPDSSRGLGILAGLNLGLRGRCWTGSWETSMQPPSLMGNHYFQERKSYGCWPPSLSRVPDLAARLSGGFSAGVKEEKGRVHNTCHNL
jgi:CRISPR-associated protein Csb2